jgi:hypothetical protein
VKAALVLACVWLSAPHDPPRSLTSGHAHAVHATARRWGLDDALPRDSEYARGVRLDAQGKWVEALRAYTGALRDVAGPQSLARFGADLGGRCADAWRTKITWQREQSEHIVEGESYAQVMPGVAVAHFNLAAAYHRKLLSVRAYLGRAPTRLWELARSEYARALSLDPHHALARLGLAALLATAGKHEEGRAEVAVLGRRRDDEELALYMAAFYVADDDDDAALAALARIAKRGELRHWALYSSDFDGLRGDPRFVAMFERVAGDDESLLRDCGKR